MLRKIFNFQFSIFNTGGFTLIELVLVIGILGILAVAVIMALDPVTQLQKGNDVRRKSDLAQIQRALESYYQDNNHYPASTLATTNPPYQILGAAWGNSWTPYMNVVPSDPNTSKHYIYYSNGQSYYIYANLDRGVNDPAVCKNLDSNGECPSISLNQIGTKSCGGSCDYAVSSPDVTP